MAQRGLILKGVGGFYTIMAQDGQMLTSKARGRFRLEGITPVCGDYVEYELINEGGASILNILERKSLLKRPPVANIDQLIIVISAKKPKPDLLLLDKLIISVSPYAIDPVVLINKLDLAGQDMVDEIKSEYGGHYTCLSVSARTGEGISELSSILEGKISCFAGQSAVGKSSILNSLIPGLDLPVGGLSKKTDRGRHTTRHAELWPYKGGAVLDTAGFSLLDIELMDYVQLNRAYREFGDAPDDCRFTACSHRSEPECAVKELVQRGIMSKGRYERFVTLSLAIEEMKKHEYD